MVIGTQNHFLLCCEGGESSSPSKYCCSVLGLLQCRVFSPTVLDRASAVLCRRLSVARRVRVRLLPAGQTGCLDGLVCLLFTLGPKRPPRVRRTLGEMSLVGSISELHRYCGQFSSHYRGVSTTEPQCSYRTTTVFLRDVTVFP